MFSYLLWEVDNLEGKELEVGLPFDIVPVAIFWLQFLGSVLES